MPAIVFSKLKPVVYTGFLRSLTGKQVPLSDSPSSLLRQLKFLSVNSGLIQSFSYSGKSLSDNRCIRNPFCLRAKTMAVSGSKAAFGDVYMDELIASCGNGLDFLKPRKQVPLSDSPSSLLRQVKFLSVNSGLIQSFFYSGKSLSDNRCIRNPFCLRAKTMAVSGSKAVFGDVYMDELIASCGNGLDFLKPSGVYFADRSQSSCQKASLILRKQEQRNNRLVCRYNFCDAVQRNTGYNLPFGPRMKSIHTSSLFCTSSRAAHDVSFDGSSKDERAASLPVQTIPNKKSFRLVSGSCYLPHPAKEETGGEDAHFICANDEAIGVADGVGGWVEVGIDAGEFARELMCNSVAAIQDEPKGSIDPARVLEKAHSSTKSQGSSTACIIALTEE
ncbi:hypothetical protein Gotur_011708, partial [Gossypium turneri]